MYIIWHVQTKICLIFILNRKSDEEDDKLLCVIVVVNSETNELSGFEQCYFIVLSIFREYLQKKYKNILISFVGNVKLFQKFMYVSCFLFVLYLHS